MSWLDAVKMTLLILAAIVAGLYFGAYIGRRR